MIAIASALLTLILFFLGYHSDPAKLEAANKIGMIGNILIAVIGIILGIRACRDERPLDRPFGYGSALGKGVLIGLISAAIGAVFGLIYTHLINQGFNDILMEHQMTVWEAQGMDATKIQQAQKFMHFMFNPAVQLAVGIIMGTLSSTLVSLIAAAFLRRRDVPGSAQTPLAV
jgi:hypothetical protein